LNDKRCKKLQFWSNQTPSKRTVSQLLKRLHEGPHFITSGKIDKPSFTPQAGFLLLYGQF